jgi:hypothetical protein
VKRALGLGFGYRPGSILVRVEGGPARVEELEPAAGIFEIDAPEGFDGEVSVDYQRTVHRGGTARPDRVIGISDACIYCGSSSDLRDEHIIPYGLEGDLVLRRGSCRSCEARTSRIERRVLRASLLAGRTALRMRSRHKANVPETLPLIEVDGDGNESIRQVIVAEHPTYISLPTFEPPAILRGADSPNLQVTGAWTQWVGETTLAAASPRHRAAKVGVEVSVDVYAFARLLGKIAHGFVAAADLGPVETPLPAALFAEGESIGWWVGGAPDVTLTREGLHGVGLSFVDDSIHVRIRLFAQFGGPEYLVVAGRKFRPSAELQPAATIEPVSGSAIGGSSHGKSRKQYHDQATRRGRLRSAEHPRKRPEVAVGLA